MFNSYTKITLLFSFLLLPPFIHSSQSPDIKKGEAVTAPLPAGTTPVPIVGSINVSPICTAEYKPTFITTNTATIHAIGIKIEEIRVLIKQTITNTFTWNNYDMAKSYLRHLLWNNRYKIAGGTALTTYSGASL